MFKPELGLFVEDGWVEKSTSRVQSFWRRKKVEEKQDRLETCLKQIWACIDRVRLNNVSMHVFRRTYVKIWYHKIQKYVFIKYIVLS